MAKKQTAKTAPVKTQGISVEGPGGVMITKLAESKDFLSSKQIWKGQPKVGKTSTAAALGTVAEQAGIEGIKPFFMLFEPGSGGITPYCTSTKCKCGGKDKKCPDCKGSGSVRMILETRKQMREWFEWAAKSEFNPIVLDTGDAMFQKVMDDVCVELGIQSPFGANDNGISWAIIFDEMRELLGLLGDKGVIILMHVYMLEKRVRGGSIQQATFNVAGKTRSYLSGWVNQIVHLDIVPGDDGDERIAICTPTAGIEAGDQWGVYPPEIKLGSSPEEAAAKILQCWDLVEME